MNEKIREHVRAYNLREFDDSSDEGIIETIRDAVEVWSGNDSDRRWWTDCFTVVNIDGMLIGFDDAKTTGDDSPRDKGWEFDPESICEVVAKEVVTTVYEKA
jgi:hypothetical protein